MKISAAHKAFCHPDWSWRCDGSMRELNLWLVLQGRGKVEMPDRVFELGVGDCFIFRHWEPHLVTHDPANPLVVPYIVFNYIGRKKQTNPIFKDKLPAVYRRIGNISFMAELMERSIRNFASGDSEGKKLAVHWLESCLIEIRHQDRQIGLSGSNLEQAEAMERICLRMEKDPSGARQIEQVAEESGYSTDHFIRIFKKYKGITPGEFCINARIKAAAELLKFSTHSITRISELLGYKDIYAFSKQFRARMGQCPSNYRKSKSISF